MRKFKMLVIFVAVALLLEIPSAYAILGTRIARKAITARRAAKQISSDDSKKANALGGNQNISQVGKQNQGTVTAPTEPDPFKSR